MRDKVVLITGANSGIGYEAALALAKMGARVVISGRSAQKLELALAQIRVESANDEVTALVADLGRVADVRALAQRVEAQHDRLDVLINNAGLFLTERRKSADGLEMTFAVNHLAPFALTQSLRGLLEATPGARVVNVSSMAHQQAKGLDFEDLQGERAFDGWAAYTRSKLANILFTRALARRLQGVTANCLHPGIIRSGFGADGDARGFFGALLKLGRPLMITPAKGARTTIYLASSPEVAEITGGYFANSKQKAPSKAAQDEAASERLWAESEQILREVEGAAISPAQP
ncbi:SDR family oxidoreductase [Myxococcota bacterium]|nr:SDR family oxidoreductase [Myxococcota bacterium]MBU1430002.1 SDR family oxidoreductase [Myxococcota bacterium]MBU1896447.1 SDR family oxidoreductase [Myxococcota bacterium]